MQYAEWNVFESWVNFGIFVGIMFAINLLFSPCAIQIYKLVKDISIDCYGMETYGTVINKWSTIRESTNSISNTRSTTKSGSTVYWVSYKYTGPDGKEYEDKRNVLKPYIDEWKPLKIGQDIPVKYLKSYPRCNKKRYCCGHRKGLFCYGLFGIATLGGAGTLMSIYMTNWIDILILSFGLGMLMCGIPACLWFAKKDCAKMSTV